MLPDLFSEKMTKEKLLLKDKGQTLTPPEIVDYMCEEVVKNYLKNKTDDRVLNILDPACGTGRFMLGIADYCWKNHVDFIMWNIDIDEKMFDACKKHALYYKVPAMVILGDVLLNDFSKGVMCKDGIEEVVDIDEITKMFKKMTNKNNIEKKQQILF